MEAVMPKYKLALVSPGKEGSVVSGSWKHLVTFYRLTLPLLAAYVDLDKYEVLIIEESVDRSVPLDGFDLVAMSVMTPYAPRAYELAREFRRHGARVVLGGIHPTLLPEEALKHADAIAIGAAEMTWPHILLDFENGTLKRRYTEKSPTDSHRILPNRSILKGKSLMTFGTVETTRGCPKHCAHCAVVATQGMQGYQQFDIESVIRDLASVQGKYVFFVDSNFFGTRKDRERMLKLLSEMRPLKKQWFCDATISLADDPEMLEAAVRAGLGGVYIGLESVIPDSLREVGKGWSRSDSYIERIKLIRSLGVAVEGGFMFGFDSDTLDVFKRTAEFVYKSGIESPNAHILTPYPGTALFERLEHEKRILTFDWSLYDTGHVVFKPINMEPEELEEGYRQWYREVFSPSKTFRRILQS